MKILCSVQEDVGIVVFRDEDDELHRWMMTLSRAPTRVATRHGAKVSEVVCDTKADLVTIGIKEEPLCELFSRVVV